MRVADILIVVGTSLVVYPAANLAFEAPPNARKIVINTEDSPQMLDSGFELIQAPAANALPALIDELVGGGAG